MTEKDFQNLEARVQRLEENQKVLESKVLIQEPSVEHAVVTATQVEKMLGIDKDVVEMWYQTGMICSVSGNDINHKKEHHFYLVDIIRLFNNINRLG